MIQKVISKPIIIGQDGTKVDSNIKKLFNLVQGLDTRFVNKREDSELFDFVGLILKKDKTLVVFPKHYFSAVDIYRINTEENNNIENDLSLLFDTIYKYTSYHKSSANKYVGDRIDFDSDYPFASFFSIYKYFQQYGIYKEREINTKPCYSGKISWKNTIKKSQKIVTDESIIHLPLYAKQNRSKQVFVGDCMTFAINYTLERFPFLFSMKKANYTINNFDFLENTHYVIQYLKKVKNEIFKDVNRRLIDNLIDYYIELDECNRKGGDIHVKIKYFNLVWEEMVEQYLNRHFIKMDLNENKLLFKINHKSITSVRFEKKTFKVDQSDNHYTISPDHYFIDENLQYIFDAKYYANLDHLNYKQYSYHEMLKNKQGHNKTISALLLPSEEENSSSIHFRLAGEFTGDNDIGTIIILQYLKMKDVMFSYLN